MIYKMGGTLERGEALVSTAKSRHVPYHATEIVSRQRFIYFDSLRSDSADVINSVWYSLFSRLLLGDMAISYHSVVTEADSEALLGKPLYNDGKCNYTLMGYCSPLVADSFTLAQYERKHAMSFLVGISSKKRQLEAISIASAMLLLGNSDVNPNNVLVLSDDSLKVIDYDHCGRFYSPTNLLPCITSSRGLSGKVCHNFFDRVYNRDREEGVLQKFETAFSRLNTSYNAVYQRLYHCLLLLSIDLDFLEAAFVESLPFAIAYKKAIIDIFNQYQQQLFEGLSKTKIFKPVVAVDSRWKALKTQVYRQVAWFNENNGLKTAKIKRSYVLSMLKDCAVVLYGKALVPKPILLKVSRPLVTHSSTISSVGPGAGVKTATSATIVKAKIEPKESQLGIRASAIVFKGAKSKNKAPLKRAKIHEESIDAA